MGEAQPDGASKNDETRFAWILGSEVRRATWTWPGRLCLSEYCFSGRISWVTSGNVKFHIIDEAFACAHGKCKALFIY
jgi:hypothetical protein